MLEHWMDWAKLIGTAIGATIFAILASWQVWTKLLRPVIKRFEPIVNEITGPGNEPGLRSLIGDVQETARSGLKAALQAADGVNGLRLDLRDIHTGHLEMRRDVDDLKEFAQRSETRLGDVEKGLARLDGRTESIERLHVERGCLAPLRDAVTEGSQEPGSAGARPAGEPGPQPPRGRSVLERKA